MVKNVISNGKNITLHRFARGKSNFSDDINIRFQISILLAWGGESGADQDVVIPSAIRPHTLVLYAECCVMPVGCDGSVPGITLKLTFADSYSLADFTSLVSALLIIMPGDKKLQFLHVLNNSQLQR